VEQARYGADEAVDIYGVVLTADGRFDARATEQQRAKLRLQRLASATPARRRVTDIEAAGLPGGDGAPIYPGVMQRGCVAYAEASGAPLAIAPDHWTDGCPIHVERRWPDGPPVVFRSYLDPGSGRSLFVEVALEDAPRSFEMSPRRWTAAADQRVG
jgi:N-methylhydantoinase B